MKSKPLFFFLLLQIFLTALSAWSDEALSAMDILRKVDHVMNAPKDQKMQATLILDDGKGNRKERVIQMMQKGSDRRLSRFLSPADQKGISVLTLPQDVIYLYLPAFKKTKRIASHIKNQRFAGTDFSYEDLEAREYAKDYSPTLLRTETGEYVLELIPHDTNSEYSKHILWVRRDNFVIAQSEMYDKKGKLYKKLLSAGIEKIDGYWVVKERQMIDLTNGHSTKMVMQDIRFDSGLSDELFTQR
ncbi:MAG TPA: outer membrane lipoprotein-sorting protein, partial [Spirochaetia bacterium]|nr:outer membrane lipoprotein-sorting protein [Spirochaetia bacterium]